ncbi:sterol carrier family protein [Streptomyces sp. NPDC058045]|uniref:maleylpyruvate isomerase family mycothiol-dependent enzyme n=1 Tax=Streptomyces sp. NPDC058045 TaxID=3346311 RepID=UPI0036F13599
MPPTRKKRPRTYDPARTRAALLAQFAHARIAVRALTDGQLAAPSGLGEWTVRELAAHLAMAPGAVLRLLDGPEPPAPTLELVDWPRSTASRAAAVDQDTRALAAAHPDPDALFAAVEGELTQRLPEAPDDRVLETRTGGMRLADYLVTRTVELVVHCDDLSRATGTEVPLDRGALAICTRLLADALAAAAPGGATEVRVPPFAVVQCVEGPRHTRGTPPNVVETDPLTWIRLATGRTTWAEERTAARVHASGERADLSGLLPILH